MSRKDIRKAYEALKQVEKKAAAGDTKYYERLSDISWYLRDKETAAHASLTLYRNKRARFVDYARISEIYAQKDLSLVEEVSIEAFNAYKNKDFILGYAYQAIEKEEFDELNRVLNEQLKGHEGIEALKSDSGYWLVQSKLKKALGKNKGRKTDARNPKFYRSDFYRLMR